jgi:hypothetical protein
MHDKPAQPLKRSLLLSELHSLYVSRLQTLGVQKQVNRTRLKTSTLENFPDAQEKNDGKNVVIIFKKAIQDIGKKVVYSSLDLGLLVLQYLHFLIFSAFSHEKTGTR